jgi:4'-phosphopantetheinyl transferase
MPIRWAGADQDADSVLRGVILAELGPGEIALGRLCPVCAASDHGRPWATHDGVPVPVSLARAGAHLLVAVEPGAAAVGVDVESAEELERDWPSTVLATAESATTVEDRLALWVAKEAILKSEGVGLSVAMDRVVVADFDGELSTVAAPNGFGAALALRR